MFVCDLNLKFLERTCGDKYCTEYHEAAAYRALEEKYCTEYHEAAALRELEETSIALNTMKLLLTENSRRQVLH